MKIINHSIVSDPFITIISIVTPRWNNLKDRILKPLQDDPLFSRVGEYWSVYHKDIDEDGHYNCCRAYNEATDLCSSEIIVYSTGDGLIEPQLIWRGYGILLLVELPVFCYRMDEQEDGSWRENNDALGEFIMVRKEWAQEVGGWDQRMEDWGAMDYDLLNRVCRFLLKKEGNIVPDDKKLYLGIQLSTGKMEDRVKHFYHSRKKDDNWYRAQNTKNWNLVKEQGFWNKELKREIEKTKPDERKLFNKEDSEMVHKECRYKGI